MNLADDEVADFTTESEVSKRLDRFCRTTVSLVWAVLHVYQRFLSVPHPPVDVQLVKVSADDKVTPQDRHDLVKHFQNLYRDQEEQKDTLEWLNQQLNKPLPHPPRIELIEEIGVYVDLPDPVREDFVELPQLPPIGYVLNDIYVLVQNSEIINKYIECELRPVRALRLFVR